MSPTDRFATGDGSRVVAEPPAQVALTWILLPLLGAGAGLLMYAIAGWVAKLRWAPWRGLFQLIDRFDGPATAIGLPLLGVAVGLFLALWAAHERLTVTVTTAEVTLHREGADRRFARGQISGIFLDRKQLVLLGPLSEELARDSSDLPADQLRAAFEAYGYPWLPGGDPHRDAYRRWVPGATDLPAGADVLLRARQHALDAGNQSDAAELRAELLRVGVVVRDGKKRQYWRPTIPSGPDGGDHGKPHGPAGGAPGAAPGP